MSIAPLITFKAGRCEADGPITDKPTRITPQPDKGYIYVYPEDDLMKFCWRSRRAPVDQPELDLILPPGDGTFVPYEPNSDGPAGAKTDGRLFLLRLESSGEHLFFWMQSKPQRSDEPGRFSERDRLIGDMVHRLLQGEDVDVAQEVSALATDRNDRRDDDGDEPMEDVEGSRNQHDHGSGGAGAGGAGADATGGDVRQEGESAREGGADGARAAPSSAGLTADAAALVQAFARSLAGNPSPAAAAGQRYAQYQKPYPSLVHLLTPNEMVEMVETTSEDTINRMLGLLPPTVLQIALDAAAELTQGALVQKAIETLRLSQKRYWLTRCLRSPQFYQSLAALTIALREGGLPDVAAALGVQLENGGRLPSGLPLGGGEALEAFVEAVKNAVRERRGRGGGA